jgi:type II secretory pathway pseudopilin PulG
MTFIEVIVIFGALATTAAVFLPTIANVVNAARIARAAADTNVIATGLKRYQQDVECRRELGGSAGSRGRRVLVGPGLVPSPQKPVRLRYWATAGVSSLDGHLRTPAAAAAPGWDGPYVLHPVPTDPWGNAYVVNISCSSAGTKEARAIYVLSAGPNETIDTPFDQPASEASIRGDDVGVRVR